MTDVANMCDELSRRAETMTYDEMQAELEAAGFGLDEYGGGHYGNPYAVFVHPCGIVVDIEYVFDRVPETRDSWRAGQVTAFGWKDDPGYMRWSA